MSEVFTLLGRKCGIDYSKAVVINDEKYIDNPQRAHIRENEFKKVIDKFYNKNITFSTINFAAGFAVAALFLSTLIPKIQYYITRKSTGVDAFPGTYDFKEHTERPY